MIGRLALARVAEPTPAAGALDGRTVLITGAAGGLGRAAALACAAAGAGVVLLGRKVRALETLYDEVAAAGPAQPAIYPLDLGGASATDFGQVADTIERECGRLDGIVHAAAQFAGLQPVDQIKPEEWARTQQVNLTAPFLLTQACLPLLRLRERAAVVFVFDDPATVGKAFWGGYGVAKHALTGLVSILHEETDTGPVRIHGLLPGPMRSALRRTAWFGEDTMTLPTPDAAGAAAAFLLGDAAADLRGTILDLRAPTGTAAATV